MVTAKKKKNVFKKASDCIKMDNQNKSQQNFALFQFLTCVLIQL